MASKSACVRLDDLFVQNYLQAQNGTEAKIIEKSNSNENVIEIDDSDSEIEYIGTELASPNTKKIAKMNEKIFRLQNELSKRLAITKAKKNHGVQIEAEKSNSLVSTTLDSTNASYSSIEPRSSTSAASTSSTSLNSSNSIVDNGQVHVGDLNANDFGDLNASEVNELVDQWHANGELVDIATEVIEFCQQANQ